MPGGQATVPEGNGRLQCRPVSTLDRNMSTDEIYAGKTAGPGSFEFDESVASVFPDMLRRSIPGYGASIEAIGALAARFVTAGSRCYDLGCSLGAATIAMRRNVTAPDCRLIGVDLAPAMIERCREELSREPAGPETSIIEADICDVEISNASMVVMNYTLQFLPLAARAGMMRRIHEGLLPGGIFVMSEKVADDDLSVENLLVDLHHDFKRRNAYSELEISRKRSALENVLIPESEAAHSERLQQAGFAHSGVWLRYFNFISFVAIKAQ